VGGPLAIEGGAPVRRSLLPYGHQKIEEEDIRAVTEVLRSEWITTGPKVAEFEGALAAQVGAKHAVSFSSGTAALHGAVSAAGLGPDDEAVTTPMTFCATANCVFYAGARPVFADVSPDTLNLDPAEAARRVTPKTKALIAVDYAGHPADLDALRALASRKNLVFIEDACHALGARYKEHPVGGIADMTVFSFHPVKHITTGEGGMVATNDENLACRLRGFRNHGIAGDVRERQLQGQWHYDMTDLGFNYRLPDVACALGLSQLRRLDDNLARRREIARQYIAAFCGLPGLRTPEVRPDALPAWHLYPIRVEAGKFKTDRAGFFSALRAEGIGVNVHYIPVHFHSYYRDHLGYKAGEFPVAEAAYDQLISLPLFHGMEPQDVADVIEAVRKVASHFAAG